jgi:hypothetical protein
LVKSSSSCIRSLTSSDRVPHLKADDELEKPYLTGFEWDKEESWTRLVVHCQEGPPVSKAKKKKQAKEEKAIAEAEAAT